MMIQPRRFLLDEPAALHRTVRFVCGLDGLAPSESKRSTVTITRTVRITEPHYGQFDITALMPATMLRNSYAKTYGQDISIDDGLNL